MDGRTLRCVLSDKALAVWRKKEWQVHMGNGDCNRWLEWVVARRKPGPGKGDMHYYRS